MRYLVLIGLMILSLSLQAQDKAPVPSAEATELTEALVKELFGKEIKAARTSALKIALAKTLLKEAQDSEFDPISYYVLLVHAKDQAAAGGDPLVAAEAILQLEQSFEIDAVPLWVETLTILSDKARENSQRITVAKIARNRIEKALLVYDYDSIDKLNKAGIAALRSAKDIPGIRQMVARKKEIDKFQKDFAVVKSALDTLDKDPTNATANLVVGKYRCFTQGDFGNGLLMLALGSDEALKALAESELEVPATDAEQMELGDSWWDYAATQDGAQKDWSSIRAGYWYRKTLPSLSGLAKVKISRRIATTKEILNWRKKVAMTESPKEYVFVGNWVSSTKQYFNIKENGTIISSGIVTANGTWRKFNNGSIELHWTSLTPKQKAIMVPIDEDSLRLTFKALNGKEIVKIIQRIKPANETPHMIVGTWGQTRERWSIRIDGKIISNLTRAVGTWTKINDKSVSAKWSDSNTTELFTLTDLNNFRRDYIRTTGEKNTLFYSRVIGSTDLVTAILANTWSINYTGGSNYSNLKFSKGGKWEALAGKAGQASGFWKLNGKNVEAYHRTGNRDVIYLDGKVIKSNHILKDGRTVNSGTLSIQTKK